MNLQKNDTAYSVNLVQETISSRRNYSAKRLTAPGPTNDEIELIFNSAASAPDHGNLSPWRFIQIPIHKRPLLADAFGHALLERDPSASIEEVSTAKQKAFNSPFIAVSVIDNSLESKGISNYEKLISLGCAIQNILISCTSLGYGSGLTSGRAMNSNSMRTLFNLNENEVCVCFINIGTKSKDSKISRIRPALSKYLSSL